MWWWHGLKLRPALPKNTHERWLRRVRAYAIAIVCIFGSADASRQPHHSTPGTLSCYSLTIAMLIFTSSGAQATLSGFEPSCYGPRLVCQI